MLGWVGLGWIGLGCVRVSGRSIGTGGAVSSIRMMERRGGSTERGKVNIGISSSPRGAIARTYLLHLLSRRHIYHSTKLIQ